MKGLPMFISKLKASAIHLLISLIVVTSLLVFVWTYWFPGALAEVTGLSHIVIILVTIDLIMGPVLTFVLFKPNKPKLKFDLSIVAVIQIAALSYGMFTIYKGHPLYVTYAVDRFTIVTANEVDPQRAKIKKYIKSKFTGPDMAFAKIPEDQEAANKLLFEVLEGAPDIDKRPELYHLYEDNLDNVFAKSINLERIFKNKDTKKELLKFLDTHGDKDQFAFLPLSGNGKDVIWAISKKTGKPVDIININPWAMAVNVK